MFAGAVVSLTLLAAQSSAAAGAASAAEQEVRKLVLAQNAAYARNDLTTYFSYFAPELTQWLQSGRMSLEAYRRSWSKFIEADGNRVESVDVSDLQTHVAPAADAVVASYLLKVVTRDKTGKQTTELNQETDVWFKRDDTWKLVHLHYSDAPKPKP